MNLEADALLELYAQDKKEYLMFLRKLLKDRPYVRLAYMTGILPIAKYSINSYQKSELPLKAEALSEGVF